MPTRPSVGRNPFNLDVLPGVLVEGKFEVRCMGSLGYQDCPFLRVNGTPCPVDEYGCYEFAILNRGTGRRVQFGGLLIHLIGEHRFFEGRQTPSRLDPREVVEVLQLAVDIEQTGGGRKASP